MAAIGAFVRTPLPESGSERAILAAQAHAVRLVAAELGNTPAVCRSSYIHPAVFAGWRDGSLLEAVAESDLLFPRKRERAALDFLAHASPPRSKAGTIRR